jgi:hypothetical protein
MSTRDMEVAPPFPPHPRDAVHTRFWSYTSFMSYSSAPELSQVGPSTSVLVLPAPASARFTQAAPPHALPVGGRVLGRDPAEWLSAAPIVAMMSMPVLALPMELTSSPAPPLAALFGSGSVLIQEPPPVG